jgi:hypothetical protein
MARTTRTTSPPPDFNAQGRFWTPMRAQDEVPPLGHHEGDDVLLAEMPRSENFRRQTIGDGLTKFPTGVIDYRRVRLSTLFPELEGITLALYYRLPRIRCCGFLSLNWKGELEDCPRCLNHGYVCPTCLGEGAKERHAKIYVPEVKSIACPSCTWGGVYKEAQEQRAVQAWLQKHWPDGVHE